MKTVKFFNGDEIRIRIRATGTGDRISWKTHLRLLRLAEKAGYRCHNGKPWAGYKIDGKTAVENELGGLTGMVF
jgi:hypothetical protein